MAIYDNGSAYITRDDPYAGLKLAGLGVGGAGALYGLSKVYPSVANVTNNFQTGIGVIDTFNATHPGIIPAAALGVGILGTGLIYRGIKKKQAQRQGYY